MVHETPYVLYSFGAETGVLSLLPRLTDATERNTSVVIKITIKSEIEEIMGVIRTPPPSSI